MKALLGILLIFAVGCGQVLESKNASEMKRDKPKPAHPVKPGPKPIDAEPLIPLEPIDGSPTVEKEYAMFWFAPGEPFRDGNTVRITVHQEPRGDSSPLRVESLNFTLGHDPNITLVDQQDVKPNCYNDVSPIISWLTFEVDGAGAVWFQNVSAVFCTKVYVLLTVPEIWLNEEDFVIE